MKVGQRERGGGEEERAKKAAAIFDSFSPRRREALVSGLTLSPL